MVVAQEVQRPMNQKAGDLVFKRISRLNRLPGSGLHGDHDIPPHLRLRIRKIPLIQGKGEHIGGTFDTPVFPVEFQNSVIIKKQDTDFTISILAFEDSSQD